MTRHRFFLMLIVLATAASIAALTASCYGPLPIGNAQPNPAPTIEGLPPEFSQLAEVYAILKEEHYNRNNFDDKKLSEAAIRGMLEAIDDPYASYLTSQQYSVETEDFQGRFSGIGAEVGVRDGNVTIVAPMPDSPAEKAGVKPGDVILAINGEKALGLSLLEAVNKIRGPEGTTVQVTLRHPNDEAERTLTITRDNIKLTSARFLMLTGGVGHLRISSFTETTDDEVKQALEKFRQARGKGLVVDLRNNPGGLLQSVVNVASRFLDEGLVVYEINAQGQRTDWPVRRGGDAKTVPMVVLVNEFSASASEVFSGAIRDHQRASLVGTKTFGKGSVNYLRPLSNGGGVYFTVARWYTPNGSLIEGEGITPDVVVENPPDADPQAEDLQMEKALEMVRAQMEQGG